MLCAARRVQSWQAALELEAVSELTSRRLAEPARRGPRPGDRAAAEIAAALTLTGRSAELLAHLATSVECLGGVRDALSAGLIDLPRARIFADELCVLDWAPAARIAARVLLDAPGLTTSQLQGRLRRAVLAADPEAGRRRQRRARDKARVQAWQEASGNGALAGRELPPADALAADRHLTALAKSMKAAGAAGTLDQLRSAIYLALLSGQDPSVVLAMHAADPDAATSEEAPECADAGGPVKDGPGPRDAAGSSGRRVPVRRPRVMLPRVMLLRAVRLRVVLPRVVLPRVVLPRVVRPRVVLPRVVLLRVVLLRVVLPRVVLPRVVLPRVVLPRVVRTVLARPPRETRRPGPARLRPGLPVRGALST